VVGAGSFGTAVAVPLDDWIAMVRAKQPPPARFSRPRWWWVRLREWFTRTLGPR
jgi:hypothetical protein